MCQQIALYDLCVEHLGVLVTKTEVAARAAYAGLSRLDHEDAHSQSVAPTEGDAASVSTRSIQDNLSSTQSTSLGRSNQMAPPVESMLGSKRFICSPKDAETGSINTRDRRRGEGSSGLEQRRSSSLDSDDIWSEIAAAVTGDSSSGNEEFLLPEEEQVRRISDMDTVLRCECISRFRSSQLEER